MSITVEEDEDAEADEAGDCPGCGGAGPKGRAWWVVHGEVEENYGCAFCCTLECAEGLAVRIAVIGWEALHG